MGDSGFNNIYEEIFSLIIETLGGNSFYCHIFRFVSKKFRNFAIRFAKTEDLKWIWPNMKQSDELYLLDLMINVFLVDLFSETERTTSMINLLKWVMSQGYKFGFIHITCAIRFNRTIELNWFFMKHHQTFTDLQIKHLYETAVDSNAFHSIKFLKKHLCPIPNESFKHCITNGNLVMLKYMDLLTPVNDDGTLCYCAIVSNQLAILKWLCVIKKIKLNMYDMDEIIKHTEMLHWVMGIKL